MAKLYVTEFTYMENANDIGGMPQIARLPGTTNVVTFTSSSVQSEVFGPNTRFVRVVSDSAACLAYGSNPTATNTGMRLSADAAEYFGVTPGQRLAVVEA